MQTSSFIDVATLEFRRTKALAEAALEQVSAEQFFAAASENDNNLALIVKHVAGNLLSRWTDFLTTDGEKPGRNRDGEFELSPQDTRAALMAQWEAGWSTLFAALAPLSDADLPRVVTIRGEPLTVLQATTRQLTHYSYHVGQIVYLAKHQAGSAWRSLSIPKGKSAEFNARPRKYAPPEK